MARSLSKLLIALAAALTALLLNLTQEGPSLDSGKRTVLLGIQNPISNTALATRTITIGSRTITVELAQTPVEQAQGLSGRPSLAEDRGMLFVFNSDQQPAFWMKDMNFPLDLIWINHDGKIIGINPDVATSTYPQTFSPQSPIKFVLEVNVGFTARHQVKVGDIIPLEAALTNR